MDGALPPPLCAVPPAAAAAAFGQNPASLTRRFVASQEYYELLHSCRAALTSFADDRYFVDTASSSVAAALIGSTPLVASSRLLQAYSYLSADAVFFVDDRMSDADAMAMLAALPDEQLGGRVAAIARLKERLFRRNVAALQKMMAQLQGAR